jgi:catechol 2,3-dioxygenase-like lactoylglutathione lyase family enzyme
MRPPFETIDHIQIAMPAGGEAKARDFYAGLLGMREIAKPPELAKRGGCWFESGRVEIHLGIDNDFRAAKKAHAGLICSDYDGLTRKLHAADIETIEAGEIPGRRRCHIHDPFGNRIELIATE